MATPPPTILSIKQSFLATQVRLLSQPLQPSRTWRRANDAAGEDGIAEKAVDDALFRLNHTLQQHARRVYAPQAARHVAEQIDALYWNAGERAAAAENGDGDDDGEGEEGPLSLGADYTNPTTIASLSPTWDSARDTEAHPMEARHYAELVPRLQALAARKQETEARVQRLRRMRDLLAPFNGESGAGSGVQENLVTRDGEVERELERMRMLLARVGDKVARLKENDDNDSLFREGDVMVIDDMEVEERRKVDGLLDLLE